VYHTYTAIFQAHPRDDVNTVLFIYFD